MNTNKIYTVSLNLILLSTLICISVFADSDIAKTVSKTSLITTSMITGTVIGTPVAIIRKTGNQYISCAKEFKKDSNTYKFWGALYSAPVAFVAGPIKGTIIGTKNAIHHSVDKPFSKEAFSLDKLEDTAPRKTNLNSNSDKPESQPWGTVK